LYVAVVAAFVAETATRKVEPTSAEVTTYVVAVAPAMSAQFAPEASQRRHWNEYVIGSEPVQVPCEAVSVCPVAAVPEIVGGLVLAGGVGAEVTTAVAADVPLALPPGLPAVTTTRRVEPESAGCTEYDESVSPRIGTHPAPDVSHRCHWYW
jgi:hypothetical protein